MNFDHIRRIHFVGIGGIGMSGLAEILAGEGVAVSGCDLRHSAATELLGVRGISVAIGHDPKHVDDADLVVMTSAVKGDHPEIDAARAKGVRVMKRAEMLGAVANDKRAVGIAGTHGKTTTSAMITLVLEEAGLDPTMLVGGVVANFETNAKRGSGDYIVVEADEYDRSFHQLKPEVAVVTNIEADHLEYYGSFEAIIESFRIFVGCVKRAGVVVGCIDDENVARLLRHSEVRAISYGLSEDAELRATNITYDGRATTFEVPGAGSFKLFVPGEHNVLNALAAIGVGRALGIEVETISSALAKFTGVDRRFQILGEYLGAIIVDDYAHHPTEIRATLTAARAGYPGRRVVALFQPHLYSRTIDFAKEFAEALRVADVPLVAPIYAAREHPVEGVSARIIADAGPGIEFLDRSNAQLVNEMRRRLKPNDIFITMGAGDVHQVAEQLVREEAR